MNPIGRQCASGLSLLLSAIRFLTRSAAHGWKGSPSGKPWPALPNVATGIAFAGGGVAGAAAPRPPPPRWPPPPPAAQIPLRSGLPSAVLGAGAVRFGLPS